MQSLIKPRRNFLAVSGAGVLSAAAVAMLAGRATPAHAQTASMADVEILNIALALEHEAIGAYELGAKSGLLQKPALDVAVLFQSHHKGHRDALATAIANLGGKAIEARSLADYANALNAGMLKNQTDVLTLATRLELGATNAYLGVIPAFKDAKLGQVAARLAADEAMHWTALSGALSRALPSNALSFGA